MTTADRSPGHRTDIPDFPMQRAAGCPFAPPPKALELNADKQLSRVRIWDGSTPWLIHGYDAIRALFTDSRASVDDRLPGLSALERGHAGHGAQAAALGVHLRRRRAHPVPPDAVKTVHVQAS